MSTRDDVMPIPNPARSASRTVRASVEVKRAVSGTTCCSPASSIKLQEGSGVVNVNT